VIAPPPLEPELLPEEMCEPEEDSERGLDTVLDGFEYEDSDDWPPADLDSDVLGRETTSRETRSLASLKSIVGVLGEVGTCSRTVAGVPLGAAVERLEMFPRASERSPVIEGPTRPLSRAAAGATRAVGAGLVALPPVGEGCTAGSTGVIRAGASLLM
jgi:hypothetical protein